MTARGKRSRPPDRRLVDRVLGKLSRQYDIHRFIRHNGGDPFRILVGCVLSLRTKDDVSMPATERLFRRASDPAAMRRLRAETIAKTIYPVGFYRRKAEQIRALCKELGCIFVPEEEVVGFGIDRLDTHVHRIANRLGWVRTSHPDETEAELRSTLARKWWIPINETLVRHGQQVCAPISPKCSECPVARSCKKIGVERSR